MSGRPEVLQWLCAQLLPVFTDAATCTSPSQTTAGMTEVSTRNFGLLIAYVIPGFAVVLALSTRYPTLAQWLAASTTDAPSVGGFLYATLASITAGMLLNLIRWLLLDPLHHWMGVPRARWDVTLLATHADGFETFVEYHFRYYQFFAASFLAVLLIACMPDVMARLATSSSQAYLSAMVFGAALFAASRDALTKYYVRTNHLLRRHNAVGGKCYDERLQSPKQRTTQ